jgi:hypothetical protein
MNKEYKREPGDDAFIIGQMITTARLLWTLDRRSFSSFGVGFSPSMLPNFIRKSLRIRSSDFTLMDVHEWALGDHSKGSCCWDVDALLFFLLDCAAIGSGDSRRSELFLVRHSTDRFMRFEMSMRGIGNHSIRKLLLG